MLSYIALALAAASLIHARDISPQHGWPPHVWPTNPWPSKSWPWRPWPTTTTATSSTGPATSSVISTSAAPSSTTAVISIADLNPSVPLLDGFVSYSIEFAFFPDYAGNLSHPNTFSNNLLNNIGNLTGTKPYIRVGGNTQDYALYDPDLTVATNGTYVPSISTDYPLILSIGKPYFESYETWPDTKFIHGFNAAANTSTDRQLLLDTVPLVCKALQGNLAYWEFGNEPDLYKTSAQGIKRPANWTVQNYVNEWLNGTEAIRQALQQSCPDLAGSQAYKYYAPSFAGTNNNGFNVSLAVRDGIDTDNDIGIISSHNYISGATSPGVTLQGTLLNHSMTVISVQAHVRDLNSLLGTSVGALPYILGETNSLYNEGRPGLSNAFGAALWGVDFNLYCASQNITRVHMHQGTNYRYQSWQPITTTNMTSTNPTTLGTKPPYYGNIAVAAILGNLTAGTTRVAIIPLTDEMEAAYAVYGSGAFVTPDRIAVINMLQYNHTAIANGSGLAAPTLRPVGTYAFQLPPACAGTWAGVRRLLANGSNSISGITWDGYSYNLELAEGMPVLLGNVTRGERTMIGRDGVISVGVEAASVTVLDLACAV